MCAAAAAAKNNSVPASWKNKHVAMLQCRPLENDVFAQVRSPLFLDVGHSYSVCAMRILFPRCTRVLLPTCSNVVYG